MDTIGQKFGLNEEDQERAAVFQALVIPDKHNEEDLKGRLIQNITRLCESAPPAGVGGYVWHREPPMICASEDASHPMGTMCVMMRVQGCVEDEWFMTYILRAITEQEPGICVRVEDEDGEFLLVEAAHELPSWVRPENATNRVWIYNGDLHLIPLKYASEITEDGDQHSFLSVSQAVALVRDPNVDTKVSHALQNAAFARIEAYPSAALEHQHRTLALVTKDVAKILLHFPQMIAEAVHALTSRDAVSVRAAERAERFPVRPKDNAEIAEDLILIPIKMTKYLYAQLSHDRFFPPKTYGQQWQQAVEAYRIYLSGTAASSKIPQDKAVFGRWCDTGAKLTAGLELAWTNKSTRATNSSAQSGSSTYQPLLASLTKLGYFGNEIPHSERWNQLADEARNLAPIHVDEQLLASLRAMRHYLKASDHESLDQLALPWNVSESSQAEDDESWLSMMPKELEALAQSEKGTEDPMFDRLGSFMGKMNEFLEGEGDMEGALLQDDDLDDLDDADIDSDSDSDRGNDELQASDYQKSKNSSAEEKQRRIDTLVAPVPLSEWGAKNSESSKRKSVRNEGNEQDVKSNTATPNTSMQNQTSHSGPSNRLRGFSSREHYEGDSDSEGSLMGDDQDTYEEREERREILDLDDPEQDLIKSTDDPVGVDGLDMASEMDDFLEFTRKTLGLSEDDYARILQDRRTRGVYVPTSSNTRNALPSEAADSGTQTTEKNSDQKLDSFDTVLDAMERELHSKQTSSLSSSHTAMELENDEDDELNEEEAELLQKLLASGGSLPASLERFANTHDLQNTDINALASFLESFKAQEGHAGPVTNLAGRLGLGALPNDQPSSP
ncbi:hypothetical protein MPSI1_003781 [Malassezia psittaci]|uniref:Uncharacterized protein n=1 Tax=Malassezia psittaci TaxID=1821823 RepID=A0AAF0JG52_9BASI|nr:hypothetical protein MPSI1_003781 [Malassezia psittaci]